jgi:hypothetical protein
VAPRTLLRLSSLAVAVSLVCLGGASLASPITLPAGLSPGDEYRLVFTTSTSRDGASADIADYNAFVTAAANSSPELAALSTTWTAIASTPTVDARDNTNTNFNIAAGVPIYRLDGTLVANDNFDLWDGSIAASISFDEDGNAVTGFVSTGTQASDGTGFPTLALGSGGTLVALGLSTATSAAWTESAGGPPSGLNPLYAISGVLVVPEPGTGVLLTAGLVALAFGRRRSAA